jgi:hypothetical protein
VRGCLSPSSEYQDWGDYPVSGRDIVNKGLVFLFVLVATVSSENLSSQYVNLIN